MKKISIVTIIILLLVAVPQNSVQAATKVTNIGHCVSIWERLIACGKLEFTKKDLHISQSRSIIQCCI